MKPTIETNAKVFNEEMAKALSLYPEVSEKMLAGGAAVVEAQAKINHEPNIDTGFLFNSIQTQKPEVKDDGSGSVDVTVGAEYAPHLEYGTVRSQAYPFLRPAVYDHEPRIIKVMAKIFAMEMIGRF